MRQSAIVSLVFVGVLLLCGVGALAEEGDRQFAKRLGRHEFVAGDHVPLYVNNIGPYHNPMELYTYDHLPWCPLEHWEKGATTLGQRLEGDRPFLADIYNISFTTASSNKLCMRHLTPQDLEAFKNALAKAYYFELICDDLPMHAFLGFVETPEPDETGAEVQTENRYFLYTHFDFSFAYNDRRIIQVNLTMDRTKIKELTTAGPNDIEFTYSVHWTPTDFSFRKRMSLYKDTFFYSQEMEIHWLSIMNSVVLVVLLTGFLAIIILRVLKNDFIRYERTDETETGHGTANAAASSSSNADVDDYGWKLIHGDVFRFPPNKTLFAAFVGIGMQLLSAVAGILILSVMGTFTPEAQGSMFVAGIVLYALTSGIGGFFASRIYRQFSGDRWAWPIILVTLIYSVPFLVVFTIVNTIALIWGSSTAQRFTTILQVGSIVGFVGLPLAVLGGIIGRRTADNFSAPCRTKNAVREIPPIPWYRTTPLQMVVSGFLPFSAIYIELFYVYSSVWGHSYYSLYGILAVVFVILLIATACITVALTYFQLSMEDHRWWWNSFACGGSTGLFVFAYSVFYFLYRTHMSGFLQGAFYFGYTSVACLLLFLLLGSVGWYSSLSFVRYIYSKLKID